MTHLARIVVILGLLAPSLVLAPAVYAAPPANDAFNRTWGRTDAPVAEGDAVRTWMWGPQAFTEGMHEPYLESPGLVRTVQYFDKSRMEITDPRAPDDGLWFVTNGLLASELISGRMQVGDSASVPLDPALVNLAGDPDDATGPTYATFGWLLDKEPAEAGSLYTQRVDRDANITTEPGLAERGVVAAHYDEVTAHTIAEPFWTFMNATGLVQEGGELVEGPLVVDVNYITGRPISEAYWSWVKVGGTYMDVLIQCFERRCLTYTPDNEPAWQVEAGNVGQHYYTWRYNSGRQYTLDAVSATDGGVITLDDARLEIPAGALAADALASLSIHHTPLGVPENYLKVSSLYSASVGGVGLSGAVNLSLPYDLDAIPSDLTADNLVIGRWDEAGGAWELRSGSVDPDSATFSVTTGELSFWQVFSPVSEDAPPPPPSPPPSTPTPPDPTPIPPPAPEENQPPVADDLSIEVAEDGQVSFALSGSDANGDALRYAAVAQPEHGSLSGTAPDLTYTPDANYFGPDSFTFTLNDGELDSNTATVAITVRPVNDPPVADDQAITVGEEGSVAITLIATDIEDDPLSFSIVDAPQSGTLSGTPPELVYTPAPDFRGSDSFTFTANDGSANSNVATVTLTVVPVNDAPTFTPGANVTLVEDSGAYAQAWATDISPGPGDEADQTTFFEVAVTAGDGLFSVQPSVAPDGTLTFTPAADAFGTATVDVVLKDDGGIEDGGSDTSAAHTLTIEVLPQNDAPSFTAGGNVSVAEDSGPQTIDPWATGIIPGPENEAGQTVQFQVVGNTNTDLFSSQPAVDPNGVLTFTPANDLNGSAEISIQIQDSGGTDNGGVDTSATQTFTIAVTAVNDAPRFTAGQDVTVLENAGPQTVAGWSTGISPGPADESGQTVAFEVTGNTNTDLFSVQPSIASDGTLTFTPASNVHGAATLTVVLQDNGGTESGGQDTSEAHTFVIYVTPVNHAPSFTGGPDVTVNEDSGAYSSAWATEVSAGPAHESDQALTFEIVGNSIPGLFSAGPSVDASGVLSFTPALDANGSATITLRLRDDGGTLNGGIDTSPTQTFTITVSPVNDAPLLNVGVDQTVLEDSGQHTVANWATGMLPGPATATDEAGQVLTLIANNSNSSLFSMAPAVDPVSGTLTYQLAPDAFGTASVTVSLQDNGGTANGGSDTSAEQTFSITVTPVNDVPSFDLQADPDQTAVSTDGAQTIPGFAVNVTAGPNETDQTLTFNLTNDNNSLFTGQPAISTDGTLTYTPAAGASGVATVTVALSDSGGTDNGGVDASSPQTFTITVIPPNQPPVANDTSVTTDEDTPVSITLTGTDIDGDALTFSIVSGSAHGTLGAITNVLCDSGTPQTCTAQVEYTPAANVHGADSFTYLVDDGQPVDNLSNEATVSLTVSPVNDPPIISNRSYTAQSNMPLTITDGVQGGGLLVGVSDLDDGDTDFTPAYTASSDGVTSPAGGTVNVSSNGDFTFDPPPGATGNVTFSYEVCDTGNPTPAACSTATVTVEMQGELIWFVNPAAAPGGNGTLASPFNLLSSAAAVDGNDQRVFVYSGTASSGLALHPNEWLIGQGVTGVSFDAVFQISPPAGTPPRPSINGTRPAIQGTVVTVNGAAVRGLNIMPLDAVPGLTANAATGLLVGEVSVSTSNASAVNLVNSGGTLHFTQVSANGGANGVVLNNLTGSFEVAGSGGDCTLANQTCTGGTIQNTTGDSVYIVNAQSVSLALMNIRSSPAKGVAVSAEGTHTGSLTVTNSIFESNALSGVQGISRNSANLTVSVTGSAITNSTSALDLSGEQDADVTFTLENNVMINSGKEVSSTINIITGADATMNSRMRGTISGNHIGDPAVIRSGNSGEGFGIGVDIRGNADAVLSITGNTIQRTAMSGVSIESQLGSSAVDVTFTNNVVGAPDDTADYPFGSIYGTEILARNTTNMCLDISVNASSGIGDFGGFLVEQGDTATFRLERFTGSGTNVTDVQNFIVDQNPGSTASATVATTYTGVADGACRMP